MLELIDLDQRIAQDVYNEQFPKLEQELGDCQRLLRAAGVPVAIVFEGWDASGKGTIINRLAQALDPRGFKVYPILPPDAVERYYPWMWRFWNKVPAVGEIAILDHSWHQRVMTGRMDNSISEAEWMHATDDIRQFEKELADSGAVIIKFWLHISKQEQKKRFKQLMSHKATAWKVGGPQRRQQRNYEQCLRAVEEVMQRTNSPAAPWTIVEAEQRRFARITVFRTVVDAIRKALAERQGNSKPDVKETPSETGLAVAPANIETGGKTILDRADLSLSLSREEYESQLKTLQDRLLKLEFELYLARRPAVICYEGWDAGGKGGNIKRLTRGFDPRGYEVVPIAAPTSEEKAHHYLWRFWRHIPKAGHITIFDRTWYGRVLVERVEGFCTETEWRRAFDEINNFERQLTDSGAAVVKFWLQIDADEQLRRFQERQNTPFKQWKITDEDWRNREKRPKYEPAVDEMLRRTSTPHAPWTILEANCKYYARIKALRTVAESLEKVVGK